MGKEKSSMEIEKKFTISKLPEQLEQYPCIHIEQGYLCTGPVVRIRKANDSYILTYKNKTGIDEDAIQTKVHNEVELPLTEEAYQHLRSKVDGKIIEKRRYVIPLEDGLKAELDVFGGYLEGLVFAEVEFSDIEQATSFQKPEWFAEDVSRDYRYSNTYLSSIERWK